ncbi:MAG: monothiol glutaredoxin, Grx4 family [Alphaproteobacteria bacterium CG11_big_fil_rev_8_21_14_0_20_44_7]|nr:MAG: monothiol glutaredoxin, Grx4 family [Alphaproteobacteria bacterium CG11_big_fil_rev_8_21_14_0_20_44_7]
MDENLKKQFESEISANDVVVYMKGTKQMPICGFSAAVAGVFQQLGVDFYDVNVLADEAVREGIKQFSEWPTIPQIYVKGEFIGGCDIIREMYETGELQQLLKDKGLIAA